MRGVFVFRISCLIIFMGLLSCSGIDKNSLTPHDFVYALHEEPGQLLDLRAFSEWKREHMNGALNLSFNDAEAFKRSINRLNRKQKYYLYCQDGIKSMQALQYMQQAGFSSVYFLHGGLQSLTSEGYSVAGLF